MLCFPSLFAHMSPKPYSALCLAGHAISECVQNWSKSHRLVCSGTRRAADFCPCTLNFGTYRIPTWRRCAQTMQFQYKQRVAISKTNEFAHFTGADAAHASIHNKSQIQPPNRPASCAGLKSNIKFFQFHTVSSTHFFEQTTVPGGRSPELNSDTPIS